MAGTTDWTNLDKTGTIFNVSEVVVHPENANNRAIDLALIKVEQKINFTDTIKSIDLPYRDLTSQYLPVKITAWGAASSVSIAISIILLIFFCNKGRGRREFKFSCQLWICTNN